MMPVRSVALLAGLALALTGCGGGSSAAPAAPAVSNGTIAQIGSGITGTLSLTVANGTGTSATKRSVKFVSPGALSAGVSINSGTTTFADVSSGSTLCTTTSGTRTCTISVGAPAGQNSFAVSLYDAASGGGHLLGSGSNSATVVAGTPFTVTVGVNPAVAGVIPGQLATTTWTFGTAKSVTVTPQFTDPASQTISGGGNVPNFLHPVSLTFSDPHFSVTPTSVVTPGQSVTISYDGSTAVASTVTATISSGGATIFSGALVVPGLVATRCNLTPQGQNTLVPRQIIIGPDHRMWWAEQLTNGSTPGQIGVMDPTVGCSSITHYTNVTGTGGPIGIAAGGDGNIWYSTGSNVLGRYSTAGTPLPSVTLGSLGTVTAVFLATDSQGNVWYLNSSSGANNQVGYVDTSLTVHAGATVPSQKVSSVSAITLGPDNAIWFTEPFATPTSIIGRVTTPANGVAGTYTESDLPLSTGSTVWPAALAAGADGNLWVSAFAGNANNQFYAKFAPSSGPVSSFSEYPNAIDPNAFANLVTMFKGADGNMWIAEGGGAVMITPLSPGSPITQFFIDLAQTTMENCVAGPDGKNYCTATGANASLQGYQNTFDSIISWTPR